MNSIKIWSSWLSSKPIESCLFVRHISDHNHNEDNKRTRDEEKSLNDSEDIDEDIENLLQSFENCVQMIESTEEMTTDCKLMVKMAEESDRRELIETRIHSFSMLCSAKVVEIHGNESQEYLKTIFNEFVEELDGLLMYRSDCHLERPQKQITISFKNFSQLWIYGIVIKLIQRPIDSPKVGSNDISSLGPLLSFMSLMNSSSRLNSFNCSDNQIQGLLRQRENQLKAEERKESTNPSETPNCDKTSDPVTERPKEEIESTHLCKCFCNKNLSEDKNSEPLFRYIDQKFSDLEKRIDNKFDSLENKMLSVFNLFVNRH